MEYILRAMIGEDWLVLTIEVGSDLSHCLGSKPASVDQLEFLIAQRIAAWFTSVLGYWSADRRCQQKCADMNYRAEQCIPMSMAHDPVPVPISSIRSGDLFIGAE